MCFNLNLWSIVYMRGGGAESKKDIHIYIREINNLIIPRRSTRWYCKTHLFNWLYMAAAKTILQYFLNVSSFQLPVDPKTKIYTNEAHHTPYMKLMQLNASPPPKRGRLSFFLMCGKYVALFAFRDYAIMLWVRRILLRTNWNSSR